MVTVVWEVVVMARAVTERVVVGGVGGVEEAGSVQVMEEGCSIDATRVEAVEAATVTAVSVVEVMVRAVTGLAAAADVVRVSVVEVVRDQEGLVMAVAAGRVEVEVEGSARVTVEVVTNSRMPLQWVTVAEEEAVMEAVTSL